MAFNSNPGEQSFIATAGQTEYDFNFIIFNDSDILVYQTPSGQTPNDVNDILTLTTDYTVIITGDAGGKVTLNVGAGVGDTLVLRRSLPQTRDTEYQTSGDLLATTLNDDQDYQTYLILDSTLVSESAIRLPDSAVGVNTKLPGVTPLYFLQWSADGLSIQNAQAVVQTIVEYDDSQFRVVNGTKKIAFSAAAITALTTRTYTWPDKDGTVAMLADVVGDGKVGSKSVNEAAIGDDKIIVYKSDADEFVYEEKPTGFQTPIQVVKSDTFSSTSTTFTDLTGMSVAITPSAATSRIRITVVTNVGSSATGSRINLRLMRDATPIDIGDAAGNRAQSSTFANTNSPNDLVATAIDFIDSPSSTSAITYKIQIKTQSDTLYINRTGEDADDAARPRVTSTIIVEEIGA